MMLLSLTLLQAASSVHSEAFDLAAVGLPDVQRRCSAAADEVVVCGRRDERYRLPLPSERDDAATVHRDDTGMAPLTSAAPCGIFAGQRRCNKAEASAYGYGDGRDPITLLTKLGRIAAGADGE
ncbi:hypothetical protein [Sphingomonas rubra]|uniref:Uncharacterized protein n=1 Tax=Sphingomonas rubra TaxID=634430 RepID=A0A1I5SVU9_9SPHN|nr:hypothetical protein [Sphingomonas rubra]SFP74905.1 hypothetical protein SAMN04488241_106189 [Sphingomonas rubra]